MTREEAIKILKAGSTFAYDEKQAGEFCEAYDMAVSALGQPEIIRCKNCKHFYFDKPYVIQGIPVLGHEVCDAWGDGCKTAQDGYCFMAERKTDE